jgi:hypothetical protein
MVTVPHDPEHESAYQDGIVAERARVLRVFDSVFAGAVVDDETQARLAAFVELVRTGRDVRS